ncbi:MAG: hypothetical protein HY906_17920 [Deltaproteobacteria bacterium]|nr:hypothetical protein [Deltaproteobacteria bacterium]
MERAHRSPGLLLCAALALGSCHQEAGRAPVARFDVTPPYVPLHDGYATVVALDGSRSKDEIDDPAGQLPLGFHWDLDDPAPQVVQGSLDAAQVQVKLQGDRPTTVTLTVRDQSGRTAVRTGYVGVTVEGASDGGTAPADSGAGDGPSD